MPTNIEATIRNKSSSAGKDKLRHYHTRIRQLMAAPRDRLIMTLNFPAEMLPT